jgi:hypothetical protein
MSARAGLSLYPSYYEPSVKIQTADGSIQAYCRFDKDTGTITHYSPVVDRSTSPQVIVPAYIDGIKVNNIDSNAMVSIVNPPYSDDTVYKTEIYVPSSISEFDGYLYTGYVDTRGYTICTDENSLCFKSYLEQYNNNIEKAKKAFNRKNKLCNVEEISMFSIGPTVTVEILNSETNKYIGEIYESWDGIAPFIENDRTLVPMRSIFEEIDAQVDWNAETRTVTAIRGGSTISLTIDSDTMYKDGTPILLDVPARIYAGTTYIPLRAVCEALNATVEWKTRQIGDFDPITNEPIIKGEFNAAVIKL